MSLILAVDCWFQETETRRIKHLKGDAVTPSSDRERDWLIRAGIVSDTDYKPIAQPLDEPGGTMVDEPEDNQGDQDDQASDDEPEEVEPTVKSNSRRPGRNRDIQVWKAYAKSIGVNIEGLATKAQIILAVDQFENR